MSFRLPAWPLSLLPWLAFTPTLQAQAHLSFLGHGSRDTVQVTAYAGEAEVSPSVLDARWIGVDDPGGGPKFHMDWAGRPEPGMQVELIELLMAGLDQYLDQRIHFTRDGVKTSLPQDEIRAGVERMVNATASLFGVDAISLSEASRQQLKRVCTIDWSQARFGVDGGDDQEKYMAIYYYVRAQRMELERNLHNDLVPLFGLQLRPAWELVGADPSREVAVPTICTSVMDEDNYLCALDLSLETGLSFPDVQLTDALLAEIARSAEVAPAAKAEPKLRKRDRWLKAELDAINRRIDQSDQRKELWALRDRMDDIEGRLDDLGLQVDELKETQAAVPDGGNPIAAIGRLTGRDLQVRFGSGSASLNEEARALLLEVVRAMAEAPDDRLLVTGRADPTGSPAANLALSEQRAKAVRGFLLTHGIGGDRVLLNYFGATGGGNGDAAERRVDLEWLR